MPGAGDGKPDMCYDCNDFDDCDDFMATITIRNLDDRLKARLRIEAATHGHSMEEEVRLILRRALAEPERQGGLGSRIRDRFAAVHGVDLDLPERSDRPRAAAFDE